MSENIKKDVTNLREKVDFLNKMLESGVEETHPAVMNALEDISADFSYLTDTVLDRELKEVADKVPNLDEVFEGRPATLFQGKLLKELQELTQDDEHLDDSSWEKPEPTEWTPSSEDTEGIEEDEEEEEVIVTLGDFVEGILEDLPFSEEQEEYKKQFGSNLLLAIETLYTRRGVSQFFVDVAGTQTKGTIEIKDGDVYVTIDGHEYVFEDKEETGYDEDANEVEDEQECSGDPEECMCGCDMDYDSDFDGAVEDALHEDIQSLDEEYFTQVNYLLKEIEEVINQRLESGKGLRTRDYDLIRYYLKNQAHNGEDVESLSDNALVLAWNYRRFAK